MPWTNVIITFEIPRMHWMEDLTKNSTALMDYFDNANLPDEWKFVDVVVSDIAEDHLLFKVDNIPTPYQLSVIEDFILTGK